MRTNSLVVIKAIVTDLSTTGGRISTIDESTASATSLRSAYSLFYAVLPKRLRISGDTTTLENIS